MKIDTKDPRAIWALYEQGQSYNSGINLYRTVEMNEAFYAGDQWRGLNAPDIDKPVLNQIRQPINYMVATIVSDDVSIALSPSLPSAEDERYLDAVVTEIERVREQTDMQTVSREAVRNAAVDGDACLYLYWDPDVKTGQPTDGDIRCHMVENTNCIFGNPNCKDPQRQPYMIIVMRDYLDDVIDEAVENGIAEDEARERIKPDDDSNQGEDGTDKKLVTKLIYMWRDGKTIHALIAVHDVIIRDEWDMRLELYPVAWFNWMQSRRSYHGTSIVTEMIPTQIYINKLAAYYLRCTAMYAWPKILYKRALFPKGWSNRIGENIAVDGNPAEAYAAIIPGTGATADVTNTLEWLKSSMRDSSGANDAALGQMKSDNTSAIIAMQEANTVPLDLQRKGYYNFQEQVTRIMLDMLRAYAGTRYVALSDDEIEEQEMMQSIPLGDTYEGDMGYETEGVDELGDSLAIAGQLPEQLSSPVVESASTLGDVSEALDAPEGTKPVDFSRLGDIAWNLKVDIGAGSYYSEVIRQRTLDNLMQMRVINPVQYLERVSGKYIPDKETLLEEIEEQYAMQQDMAAQYGDGMTDYGDEVELDDSIRDQHAKTYIQGLRQGL